MNERNAFVISYMFKYKQEYTYGDYSTYKLNITKSGNKTD